MRFIIYDLEATCWAGNLVGRKQEIIEVGALISNELGSNESTFNKLVRPVQNPSLSVYCKDLTGITQDEVESAKGFKDVISSFMDWIDVEEQDYILCSWGAKDIEFLTNDCLYHGIQTKWLENYIDLKEQYHSIHGLRRNRGLAKVLKKEGIEIQGQQHRAYDDAVNLYSIFYKYRDDWMF